MVVSRDIGERRRAEDELRASEAKFRALYEMNFVGVAFWDAGGGVPEANDALCRMMGYAPEELRAGAFNWRDATPPEHRAADERALAEMAGGAGRYAPFEKEFYRKDGSRVPVLLGGALLPGRRDRGVSFVVDLSARKRAEAAQRESEEKFRLLADTIPQLAWMARPDGHVFWYNRRWHEYTGTTPAQMEGWGWRSVHDPAAIPEVLERWQACLASGEPFDMVFPLRGADGVFRPFLTRVSPLRDGGGRVLYWFGTNTDIGEQKRAEADARFLADASAALAGLVDDESTLQKVARLAVPAFADWCAVDMLDEAGALRRLAVAHADPAKVELARELHRRYPPDPAAPQGVWNVAPHRRVGTRPRDHRRTSRRDRGRRRPPPPRPGSGPPVLHGGAAGGPRHGPRGGHVHRRRVGPPVRPGRPGRGRGPGPPGGRGRRERPALPAAAGGRPPQGRVPGPARARAAQPARPDPQRPARAEACRGPTPAWPSGRGR